MAFLYDYQEEAVRNMKNGCILCGGVGSGKSRTSLAYYFTQNGGTLEPFKAMQSNAKDLYIITTARIILLPSTRSASLPVLITTGMLNSLTSLRAW